MDPIGKAPIPWPIVIVGKLALLCCILFFMAKSFGITMLYDSAVTQLIGYLLAVAGFAIVTLGFVYLGKSVSVGLSREETELKTLGVYRITRNPLYFGGFLICSGSCFYSIHPANFFLFALTVVIHHSIILKEEQFLEHRFGQQWLEYKKRTPRYVGMMGKTSVIE